MSGAGDGRHGGVPGAAASGAGGGPARAPGRPAAAAARAPTYAPDRSAPPPTGPPRGFSFPPFVRRPLGGGPALLAARRPGASLARISLLFPAGGEHDPRAEAGLAAFTGALLDEGTRRRAALEIAARIERLGGHLATGADWDAGYLSVALLARHAAAGLELLAELAAEPAFPPEEIERERRQRLAEVLRQRADPGFVARERFAREVYGDHPYGGQLLGAPESLAGFDRAAVERFYRRHYTAAGAFAVAVGDLDPEAVAAALERAFAGGDGAPPRPELTPPAPAGIRVHLVDRPGAAQTELVIGHAGIPRTHPDYLAMTVVTTLLGGKFTSRINLNLRERLGYTYGASCRLYGRRGPGPLVVSSAVANPVAGAAAREVLAELARIRDEPVGGAELEETRSYLIGVFPYTLQTVDGLAGRLENLAVYGLPDDHYATYPERLRALDPETLQAAARTHLHPGDLVVVAVGPAAELAPQFEGVGALVARE